MHARRCDVVGTRETAAAVRPQYTVGIQHDYGDDNDVSSVSACPDSR